MAGTAFSVIVTSYNYEDFVLEAVDSALAQSRAPLEVIVVDDGSSDGSPALLRDRYGDDRRVTLLFGENGGQLAAFQSGLAAARGDVVCFLDADDVWRPDFLARIGEVYDTRPDVDFVFSDVALFGREERVIGFDEKATDLGYTALCTYAFMVWYGAPTSALSLRAALARRTLDLPEAFARTWRLSADNCLVFGASVLGGRKYFLPTGSVGYRIHGSNGWWSKRSPTANYLNRLRSRGLIEHYARSAGVCAASLELAKHEFRTKPEPSWKEIKRYARLCLQSPAWWGRRLEQALGVLLSRSKKSPSA